MNPPLHTDQSDICAISLTCQRLSYQQCPIKNKLWESKQKNNYNARSGWLHIEHGIIKCTNRAYSAVVLSCALVWKLTFVSNCLKVLNNLVQLNMFPLKSLGDLRGISMDFKTYMLAVRTLQLPTGHRTAVRVTHTSLWPSAFFCSYHSLTSSIPCIWTDAWQHGIYLLNTKVCHHKYSLLIN